MPAMPAVHARYTNEPHAHFCYILSLIGDDYITYVGYTVNMSRRLRQHNGELVGGARFTTRHGPAKGLLWRVVALVTSNDLDHRRGLSLEWHIKHPEGHKRRRRSRRSASQVPLPVLPVLHTRCAAGRVRGLVRAMVHGKFAGDMFTAWIAPEFRGVMVQAMVDASHMQRCDVHDWPPPPSVNETQEQQDQEQDQNMDEEDDADMEDVDTE